MHVLGAYAEVYDAVVRAELYDMLYRETHHPHPDNHIHIQLHAS